MDNTKINETIVEETSNSTDLIEDGEIQEILELEGIEVWGQHQTVLEQQALSHLQSLQSLTAKNDIEEGEITETENNEIKTTTQHKPEHATLDINKFIERQKQLKTNQINRRKVIASENSVSEKSLEAARKVSDTALQKNSKKDNANRRKKKRKDSEISSEISNVPEEICDDAVNVNDSQINESGSEYFPSDDCQTDDEYKPTASSSSTTSSDKALKRKRTIAIDNNEIKEKVKLKDDGLLSNYKKRQENSNFIKEIAQQNESIRIEGKLKIPNFIWSKLYSYQQEGVKWLWNMHKQSAGGLLGDEMGLGKTVQIIVFLAALNYSKITSYNGRYHGLGPSIIVCPATVIHQWVQHFHDWWPPFRVALLHQSGSYNEWGWLNGASNKFTTDGVTSQDGPDKTSNNFRNKIQLINEINKNNGILITTYESVLKYKGVLNDKKWHYLILDEGHKIRNPNAKITIAVKHFKTPHKLILTGSPMQNNLQELWSLFDFIVPSKLGTQQAFTDYFATPIIAGGYTNATPTQETTALLIATTLKDMISPYMLRRTKDEVRDCIFLPNKSEQVLFCSLTDEQRDLYRGYLLSEHVGGILGRVKTHNSFEHNMRANILVGITTLRKMCNHPDLYLGELTDSNNTSTEKIEPEKTFGYYKRSGKMVVVAALLKIWKRQGHRVLLFTQSRAMIGIFEDFLTQQNYTYLKMDGSTSVSNRQPLIDKFNQDTSYHVFLLTTRVGGLGVNLIGANRVIIYDPDWNPATDTQARERAWRIGQERQVTVYRLVSAGTIEEKMYQRQVWKQLLSNKILIDPKTKRFFKSSDLTELFSLQEHTDKNPETANIFRNSKIDVNINNRNRKTKIETETKNPITFSEDKIQAMKSLAAQISKNMSQVEEEKKEKRKKEAVVKEDRPTPVELLAINRMKLISIPEPITNKIDDKTTNDSFADALTIAEKTSTEYKNIKKRLLEQTEEDEERSKAKKVKLKNQKDVKVDVSGEIDGEQVEGLLKREIKKKEKTEKKVDKSQDTYVLEKLFSRKGVHTALQHDVIVQSDYKDRNTLKIHYEAQLKADMALKALRKSRLNNWSW